MEYIKEIISFIVGAISGGLTVKWYSSRTSQKITNQSGNIVGGDFAGRDLKK